MHSDNSVPVKGHMCADGLKSLNIFTLWQSFQRNSVLAQRNKSIGSKSQFVSEAKIPGSVGYRKNGEAKSLCSLL